MAANGGFLVALSALKRRPVVLALSIVTFLAAYPCFFSVVSFAHALSPAEALAKWRKPLPVGWTAGVMNHGEYYRWWPVSERPVLFLVSLVGLIASLVWLWGVLLWACLRQRKPKQGVFQANG